MEHKKLRDKIEALLKGLMRVKEQQDAFVPTIKAPQVKAPSVALPKMGQLDSPFKVSVPSAPTKMPGAGVPVSKKDPVKVAEQSKNPAPKKAPMELLKIHSNGQWSLLKNDAVTRTIGSPPKPATFRAPKVEPIGPHHGFHTHTPEQHSLIDGLTLHNTTPIGAGGAGGGAAFAASSKHPHRVVVKNSAKHASRLKRGHMRNNFNAARREVLYHDLAHKAFGLGQYVPTTAGFTVNKEDWSAQKAVDGASHLGFYLKNDRGAPVSGLSYTATDKTVGIKNKNHAEALKKLNNSGELDKLAIMDFLLGHHDRHSKNYLVNDDGSGIHLIDNGTAFDYGNFDAHPIPGYRRVVQQLALHGNDGHNSEEKIHPEAQKWLKNLDLDKVLEVFKHHGHDEDNSPAVIGFLSRLLHLQFELSGDSGLNANEIFRQGQIDTHQQPEDYI